MLNLLLVSILVASAAGVPRSRGEPLHRSLHAQSGGTFHYNQNVAVPQTPAVHMVPVALNRNEQVPAAPQFQQVVQHRQQNYQVDSQSSFENPPVYGQPTFHQSSPVQQIFRHPPAPQALPVQPTVHQALPGHQHTVKTYTGHPRQWKPADNEFTTILANPSVQGSHSLLPPPSPPSNEIVKRLIGNPPGGALLVGTHPPIFPIEKRLISNYTKLRPVVKDTFRCAKSNQPNYVGYGYYADVDNDCQIFHVCLPWKELYPKTFDTEVTYQFSFICPNQTVFSQDVLTCTWRSEAFPCADSPHLYWINDNFFRKVNKDDGFGMRIRYAHVNEKLEPPLKYDYDDFNP